MCDVAEQLENEGIRKGKIKGKIEVYFFDMHLPTKDIAEKVNIPEEEVNKIIQEQEKNR